MFTLRAGSTMLLVLLAGLLPGGGIIGASAFAAQGTWYEVGVAPTACGQMHYDDEYVVALGHGIFDTYPGANTDNPNTNPICNKLLHATYQGKSVVVKVVDRCAGCAGTYDTDFSPAAFSVLAAQSVGRINLEWEWVADSTPVGPATPDSGGAPSSTEERRARTRSFGRRKPLDPPPARPLRGAPALSTMSSVPKPVKRRYLTAAERA